ncbi:hypothetical protein IFM89_019248 [Coptis chinensis]|uniref:RRM domain-containing protein n=1 Tax=Coptis chinensis TaxID=261450 RepID=A0A835HL68_9MAGN|nr:hypothetical protein IFM89_019248 [Coptis chinensis]
MDPTAEEQLDYGEEEYSQKLQYQGGGGVAISALAEEEELLGDEDEYDDLYNDVNVGEGFLQQLHRSETVPLGAAGGGMVNGVESQAQKTEVEHGTVPGVSIVPGKDLVGGRARVPEHSNKGVEEGPGGYQDGGSQRVRLAQMSHDAHVGSDAGLQVAAPVPPKIGVVDPNLMPGNYVSGSSSLPNSAHDGPRGAPQLAVNRMGINTNYSPANENLNRPVAENSTTMLFVGELHWWTTDAELEGVLSQYGRVKEIKFFDERASGKSKGYCQVEFFDPNAAASCKDGMNGHPFNGRPCVVAFASPQTLKQMGASYINKAQAQAQSQPQGRRPNDGVGRGTGMNYQGGDTGRNFGKVGWGRGGPGMVSRGQMAGGPMRGRGGGIGPRNMVNNGGVGSGAGGANPYGQGFGGPGMGGPAGGMMHPQNMMNAGFDPTYMGRGGGYGGFPGPVFPGMMPSYPTVNTVGLPGVAPHVNPAFFGRGMPANGMGIMGSSGMDGHNPNMWTDTSMGGWGGEEQGRTRESSYGGDDGASDYGYGDASHERAGREQEFDRPDKDRRYREEKDGYRDQRQREREWDNGDDWDRGQPSSRARSKSSMIQEDDHRSRSRDVEYRKRRRLPSE